MSPNSESFSWLVFASFWAIFGQLAYIAHLLEPEAWTALTSALAFTVALLAGILGLVKLVREVRS